MKKSFPRIPRKKKGSRRRLTKGQFDLSLMWVAWCCYFHIHALKEACEHADAGMRALTKTIAGADPHYLTPRIKKPLTALFLCWSRLEKYRNQELAPMVKAQLHAANQLKKALEFDKRMAPIYRRLFVTAKNKVEK